MKLAVVGLGTIGLPVALRLADLGAEVVGCDVNSLRLAQVSEGTVPGVEPYVDETLQRVMATGRFTVTSDTATAVARVDAVLVIVRLEVDVRGRPDFAAIDSATHEIGRGLRPGQLVCYETTVPVGTTRERFGQALAAVSGLSPGADFHLSFSPERVSAGSILEDLRRYPKIVGGLTPASSEAAAKMYRDFLDCEVLTMSSIEAAEFVKVAETTYRDVNIGLANEFARFADERGLDLSEVVAAANSQPYSHIHSAGIGVGGHCIPVYPHFFMIASKDHRLTALARDINNEMPTYAVDRLTVLMGGVTGRRILILGLAFRGNVTESSNSVAIPLAKSLADRGAHVRVHDPLIGQEGVIAMGFEWSDPGAGWAEGLILQAAHDAYRSLAPQDTPGVRAVLDGRGVLDPAPWRAAGVAFGGVGR